MKKIARFAMAMAITVATFVAVNHVSAEEYISMAEALSMVSADNAVDLDAFSAYDAGDDLVGAVAFENGPSSRQWRLPQGYSIPVVATYSSTYGWRDLCYIGDVSSGLSLELTRGYYDGAFWYPTWSSRNASLWETGMSQSGIDWLPILGAEVYLDLAWATAYARDLAVEAAGILDDLYTIDSRAGVLRREGFLVDVLVDRFYRIDDELSRALDLRGRVLDFAQAVVASGGAENPLEYGRPYGGILWDFYDMFGSSISREMLDDFIGRMFGWDCVPRASIEDGVSPTPTPVPPPPASPTPVPPSDPTQPSNPQPSDPTQPQNPQDNQNHEMPIE